MSANFVSNARLLSESTASQRILRRDLESVISRHFAEKYYNLIILPSCNPDFYYGWMNEIQELVVQHRSLQYSVLACAASHLHFVDTSSQMQELALTYYSQAIRGLSEMLASASQIEDHNGILMSVILLYLHGVGLIKPAPLHSHPSVQGPFSSSRRRLQQLCNALF